MLKRRWRATLTLIISMLFLVTSLTPMATYPHNHTRVSLQVNVVVIIFDYSDLLDSLAISRYLANLLGSSINVNVVASGVNVSISYNFNVTVAKAPLNITKILAEQLASLYEGSVLPGWIPLNYKPVIEKVAWLNVSKAYDIIYRLSVEAASLLGLKNYDELITIIGNIDDYNRVYYYNASYKYVEREFVGFTGFRGLAGPEGFAFYDLSSIAAPWPQYPAPPLGNEVPVTLYTDPPLQMLDNPNLYAAKLVYGHIVYHYVGVLDERIPVACPTTLRVLWVILDFGDESVTNALLKQSKNGLTEFTRLARSVAPWLSIQAVVKIVKASEEFDAAYSRDHHGFMVFDYSKTNSLLSELVSNLSKVEMLPPLGRDCLGTICLWVFFLLATPEPSYFTAGGDFNFTGFSSGSWAASTYPGWHDRVLRAGLPRVAAHELGHSLGLSHPFDYNGTTWWLMDEVVSVMSYMDFTSKMLEGVNLREAGALAAACIAALKTLSRPLWPLHINVYNVSVGSEHPKDYINLAMLVLGSHVTGFSQQIAWQAGWNELRLETLKEEYGPISGSRLLFTVLLEVTVLIIIISIIRLNRV